MLGDGVLEILPNRGLDQSILLAILIGILVLLACTEWFGWGFVGLVVPGYLASVFVIQTSMGVTILCEAVVTYLLVHVISDRLDRTSAWSPFFGRERFFLIVLVSVIVRQNSQIWIWPLVLGWIDDSWGTNLHVDSTEFSSIGLVLVPLVANMFWKITVWRGFCHVGVPVFVTYLFLEYLLLPLTNLSFSSIEITYGNVALNFINSPKAYIVLVVTSVLAARFNVRYGWDYNGILVPSLLALAWFEPWSILVTVVEVLLLWGTVTLVLGMPLLRTINLEGPRKITAVFFLSFVLKYILATVISSYWPHLKVTDLFGFGYVVTSLITVKMLQKKVIGRVLLPTLQVSLVGFLAGSLLGFGLDGLAPREDAWVSELRGEAPVTATLARSPLGVVALGAVRTRPAAPPGLRQGRPAWVLDQYGTLWDEIDAWLVDGSPLRQPRIAQTARALGLELRELPQSAPGQGPAYMLAEAEERLLQQTGWDTAVLIPGAPGPSLVVPRPISDAPAAEVAAVLCEHIRCRAIVISGQEADDGGRSAADALASAKATSHVAAMRLDSAAIVQLRVSRKVPVSTAHLHLHHKLPAEVHLKDLWHGESLLDWSEPPEGSLLWRSRRDALTLVAHPEAMWEVLTAHAAQRWDSLPTHAHTSLKQWLTGTFGAVRALGLSQTLPSESEVRFIEHMLASRLLERRPSRMRWLHHLAGQIDFQVVLLPDCAQDTECWVLGERERPVKHRWGTLVVRGELGEPVAIEVPRPLLEAGTWELGLELWQRTRGAALAVGHDMPASHGVQPLEPTRYGNVATPLHAMHQAIHRALAEQPGATIGQVRGFGSWRPVAQHLVIGVGPPVLRPEQRPQAIAGMLEPGGALGWMSELTVWAGGEPELVTMHGQGNPQITFTAQTGGVEMALLWFSEPVRQLYLDEAIQSVAQRIAAVGFSLDQRSAIAFLTAPPPPPPPPAGEAPWSAFEPMLELAERYAVTQDVIILRRLRDMGAKEPHIEVDVAWSTELGAPLLTIAISGQRRARRAVVLLTEFAADCPQARAGAEAPALAHMLGRRCRSITFTATAVQEMPP